jgi:4-amino-4-deoxy-L-arabinose transferase-like glycosyltransferase
VPGALEEAWRARRVEPATKAVLIWLIVPWVFLELVWSKLPHYILPAYVPLMVLFGRMWGAAIEQRLGQRERGVGLVWAGLNGLVGVGVVVAGVGVLSGWLAAAVALVGVVLVVGFAAVGWRVWQARLASAWLYVVRTVLVAVAVLGAGVLPLLEPARFSRQIAARVNDGWPAAARVAVLGYAEPTLFYYLDATARPVEAEGVGSLLVEPGEFDLLIAREGEWVAAGRDTDELTSRGEVLEGVNYTRRGVERVWLVPLDEAADG